MVKRIAFWCSLGVTLLLAAAWGLTLLYNVVWLDDRGFGYALANGAVHNAGDPLVDAGWYFERRHFLTLRDMWWVPRWEQEEVGMPVVLVPLWIPAVLSAGAAGWAWARGAAQRRARSGLCPKCGYPRAGLAPSAPCPECGVQAR